MEFVLYLLIFLTTSLIVYIFLGFIYYKNKIIKERLNSVKTMSLDVFDEDNELKEPFIKRIVLPTYNRIVKGFENAAPAAIKEKYEKIILRSGLSNKKTFNSVLLSQLVMSFLYGGLLIFAYRYSGSKVNVILVFLAVLLGFQLPVMSLYSKANKRKDIIRKTLPDLLDLLYISVEAGLGLDMALKRSAEKMRGPLSDEILKMLNEISKGRIREEAMKGLAHRTGVKDVATFITAIIQTEQIGSNIANMLRVQSETMREVRKQRAEELAAKVPIKMLFPLIFLLFPSLFVVILGPALINIFENFISIKW